MNTQELPVVTPQEARSGTGAGVTLCRCGCKRPAAPGSFYFQPNGPGSCKAKFWELQHPRLDLSGVDAETCLRIKRMVEEAVRAAKEGVTRATVDASHPVKRERDARPSCRVRLDQETWDLMGEMLESEELASRSLLVAKLVGEEYPRWYRRNLR